MHVLAPASYAQNRTWFDLYQTQIVPNNLYFSYRILSDKILSITQLCYALQLVVRKHESLRTALIYDIEKNSLLQMIMNSNHNKCQQLFSFTKSFIDTCHELKITLHEEFTTSNYFNLEQGTVFRCHVIQQRKSIIDDLLNEGDIICFTFHPALIDEGSMNIFFHDLDQALKKNQLIYDNEHHLRYIDCEIIIRFFSPQCI